MNKIIQYPLRERIRYLNNLQFKELLQIRNNLSIRSLEQQTTSIEKSKIIKQQILNFLPKNSMQFLSRTFKYVYPFLPIFVFNQMSQTPNVIKLQVALSSILIGDYINQLTFIDNSLFKKYITDKYLLLSADYFHIKGSVYGASLNNSSISYYMSCIEGDLSKARLLSLTDTNLQIEQFCNFIEWKASPYKYGYGSLYLLNDKYKEQEGLAKGYNRGILECLKRFDKQPSIFNNLKNVPSPALNIKPGKASILLQCLKQQVSNLIQFQYQICDHQAQQIQK